VGDALLSGEVNAVRYNDERFHIGPIKILADGSPQGRTAYLTKPYYINPPDNPDALGFPSFARDDLQSIVQRYHEAGFQMAIHGNGDAAIDDILYAFEQAQNNSPHDDPRLIIVHAQMARRDQLPAMKALGITPSFFSNHTYFWGDAHFTLHMGPQRAPGISPAASAQALDLRYSIHTDAPVTPIDPMQLISSAVERRSISGRVIGEQERISVIEALRSITIDAAWQMRQEHDRGSIEVGKLADLVVLSEDPTKMNSDFADVVIEETIVGGRTIYRRVQ
jgi:predicted amidohydrolase YtcJ